MCVSVCVGEKGREMEELGGGAERERNENI